MTSNEWDKTVTQIRDGLNRIEEEINLGLSRMNKDDVEKEKEVQEALARIDKWPKLE